MPINMTNLSATLQAMIDTLGPGATAKDLLLLSKAVEAVAGNATVSDVLAAGANQLQNIADDVAARLQAIADAGDAIAANATAKLEEIAEVGAAEIASVQAAGTAQLAGLAVAARPVRVATAAGVANSITLACTPPVTALTAPLVIAFVAAATNAGPVEVNPDANGFIPVKDADGKTLADRAIIAGRLYTLTLVGGEFRVGGGSGGSVSRAQLHAYTLAL